MTLRLLIHVEGETEETFVEEVLAPYLYERGYVSVGARLLGNSRARARRGGIRSWPTVKGDIVRHLLGDRQCIATTMVDYYALPAGGPDGWPGRAEANLLPFEEKAAAVHAAIQTEVEVAIGEKGRFVPYVTMHEFEALLFSDCEAFARGIGQPLLAAQFTKIRSLFNSPEEINDSPQTAPSKRVVSIVSGYQKPLFGTLAALEVGLERMRQECPQFQHWIECLENRALKH